MRIGQGFDVHKFGGSNPLLLGGVKISFHRGLVAHSDGDVLVHAIIDALLGALSLGDIGKFFPDSDVRYKNADSRVLLRVVYENIKIRGYELVNLDATIIAEKPKIQPYIAQMCANIAEDLWAHCNQISIKATTTEGLGFVGREEGIACQVTLLLQERRIS